MQVHQRRWSAARGWEPPLPSGRDDDAQLVLLFGATDALADGTLMESVRRAYPKATVVGGSTAGEIMGTHVTDGSVVVTAVHFERTAVRAVHVDDAEYRHAGDAGRKLGIALEGRGLAHVFVVSDGQHVNGSELVRGLQAYLPPGVAVTGGLAGDGDRFRRTLVVDGSGAREGRIVALGLYGERLRVGYGSLGGWDSFGHVCRITKSDGNVLQELNGRPALDVYKECMGADAAGLPASGLLYPLSVRVPGHPEVVRTILNVSDRDRSLTFAGDIPEGAEARMMKANFDRLVSGAQGAAEKSHGLLGAQTQLALLVSCIGRRLVLQERTGQELEAVQQVLGPRAALAGFYSYGEICPTAPNANCELHNQTMTITALAEA